MRAVRLLCPVHYCFRAPAWPLSEFVERLWHLTDTPSHSHETIVPGGTIELVINLCEDELRIYDPAEPAAGYRRFPGAVVSGAYRQPFATDTKQHAAIIGVHFKPGGAAGFLRMPADEIADAHVSLETLWGAAAIELREQLCAAHGPVQRFDLLERALMRRLPKPQKDHARTVAALQLFTGGETIPLVREVAREVGLSERQFVRSFAQEVGMSPKLFSRVARFHRVLAQLKRSPVPAWTELALDCGYFDQAHLINEFRSFSNLSPTEYLRKRSDRAMPGHVPLEA